MNIMDFVNPALLILVPVLNFIGIGLKKSTLVNDKFIPLMLGGCGILFSVIWVLATNDIVGVQTLAQAVFMALTQGILCAGLSVYCDQIFKQLTKN